MKYGTSNYDLWTKAVNITVFYEINHEYLCMYLHLILFLFAVFFCEMRNRKRRKHTLYFNLANDTLFKIGLHTYLYLCSVSQHSL